MANFRTFKIGLSKQKKEPFWCVEDFFVWFLFKGMNLLFLDWYYSFNQRGIYFLNHTQSINFSETILFEGIFKLKQTNT